MVQTNEKASDLKARRGDRYVKNGRDVNPDRLFTEEELEFLKAMDAYKRNNHRPFPSWKEVLEVLKSLGYQKVAEPALIPKKEVGQPRS